MPDMISPILRRSFPFRAIPKNPKTHEPYDYAQGLAGSQAMFLVLEESAAELADPLRDDAPIRGVLVMDTDYSLEYVDLNKPAPAPAAPAPAPLAAPAESTHPSPSE